MTWAVWINDTNVADLGLYVERVPGWLHGAERAYSLSTLPGRMGGLLTSEPEFRPRRLSLVGTVQPGDNSIASRATYERRIKALAYQGLVTLTIDDDVNTPLRIDAVCEAAVIEPKSHPFSTPVSSCELRFLCPDPSYYDLQASIIAIGSTATPIPTGTAPHGGILRIAAPVWSANVTNPTITYATSGGATVQVLLLNGLTLVAGEDYVELDLDRATITLSDAGVRSNAISYLSAGDSFFSVDPTDGDPINNAYPTVKVVPTGGTAATSLTYSRRWL